LDIEEGKHHGLTNGFWCTSAGTNKQSQSNRNRCSPKASQADIITTIVIIIMNLLSQVLIKD